MLSSILSDFPDSLKSHGATVQAILVLLVLLVGLVQCVGSASALLRFFWRQYLRPAQKLTRYGKWAIVTGATDGIGREYCNVLAKQGVHINAHNVRDDTW
jgi:17beta-estradiol 17-dehydrogenase / very-long-chain 3-oxoacyl-CoA reductase